MSKILDKCKRIAIRPLVALVVRIFFATHCVVAAFTVVLAYNNVMYWLLTIVLIGLLVETVVILWLRGGQEWIWFSPGMFCYLVAAIPSIWLLEIKLNSERLATLLSVNATGSTVSSSFPVGGIGVQGDLASWALAVEQSLLFILIIGRWILPKGEVSRNQLSQLLLVYLGMAADIMELFEVFKEEQVIRAQHLIYPILSLYTWALMQYALAITSVKARKTRMGNINEDVNRIETSGCCRTRCSIDSVNADVLGIMSTIVMQDGPFLCFRLYLLVGLKVISQMMVFFTCKNLLVLLLQIYRLITIYLHNGEDDDDVSTSDVRCDDVIENSSYRPGPDGDNTVEKRNSPELKIRSNRVSPEPEMNLPHSVDFDSDNDDVTTKQNVSNHVDKSLDRVDFKRRSD